MQESWYLVYTKSRQEQSAMDNLSRQKFKTFLPKLRIKQLNGKIKTEILFPRYLFVSLRVGIDDLAPIRSTVGVSSLVKFGFQLAKVQKSFVSKLLTECDDQHYIEYTEPGFDFGDSVRVNEGLLSGYEAVVTEKKGKNRVELLFLSLGGETRIDMPEDCLQHIMD